MASASRLDLWLHAGFDVVVNGSRAASAAGAGALSIGAAARLFTGFAGDPPPAPAKTVAVKTPVKLTPDWRALPAILHRIAIAQ